MVYFYFVLLTCLLINVVVCRDSPPHISNDWHDDYDGRKKSFEKGKVMHGHRDDSQDKTGSIDHNKHYRKEVDNDLEHAYSGLSEWRADGSRRRGAPVSSKGKVRYEAHGRYGPMQLMQIVILNRHGHRTPNTPYWSYCPRDSYNRKLYDVASGQLTTLGYREEFKLGRYIRKVYGDFVGLSYDPQEHYLRAVAEPRTMQSALVAVQGVFPRGFGPGYNAYQAQYVAVYSDTEDHEYLLADFPCANRTYKDVAVYMAGEGARVIAEHKNKKALSELHRLCRTPEHVINSTKPDDYIKTVVDGIIFNHDYGMNVLHGQVTPNLFHVLRNISNTIQQGKMYGTDVQQTYASVNFPHELLHRFHLNIESPNLTSTIPETGVPSWNTFNKFSLYVGHREQLYGVAHFFGMDYRIPGYFDLELPTASALIFTLYNRTVEIAEKDVVGGLENSTVYKKKENKKGKKKGDKLNKKEKVYQYFVETTLWTPNRGSMPVRFTKGCKDPYLCTWEELKVIYNRRIERTGPWNEICNFDLPIKSFIKGGPL